MTGLQPIAEKLSKRLRLLASDCDGEVVAASRAIKRTLEGEGLDFLALAVSVETAAAKKFSEADAREIYLRGVEEGRRIAASEGFFRSAGNDEPDWHEIALECAAHPERLQYDRERGFVEDMVRRTVHGGEPTEKQAAWLRKIYAKVR